MLFLNSTTIFPFAFNPENVDSREVVFEDRETLTVNFDMTVEEAPECAAVAAIYDTPKHFNELKFNFHQEGEPLNITVELKTLCNGNLIKFREQNVSSNGCAEFFNIEKDIKEIVFCCWRANNKGKKGNIRIKASW